MEPILPDKPSSEDLAAENARLRQQNAALTAQVADLTTRLEAALAEIDRLKRSGKRQATPFSKGKGTATPKKPGRKKGQGKFTRRSAPSPESYTREVSVSVAETTCPDCGEGLLPEGVETVTRTDLPPVLRLDVHAFHLEVCRCRACHRRVRATHPEVPRDQTGATAHRVGERLLALAHTLHYGVGVPVRRVPEVLSLLFGKVLTQGAITQDALRRAHGRVGAAYESLREQIAQEPAVNTDDTGWKVGGATAFLMGFFSVLISFFQIRPRHRNVSGQ